MTVGKFTPWFRKLPMELSRSATPRIRTGRRYLQQRRNRRAHLRATRKFLRAPDLAIAERWSGVYAKHPEKPLVVMEPEDGVRIVASPGGSGMTLSFGVAEKSMRALGFIHV